MRISADMVSQAPQFTNTLKDREIDLRGEPLQKLSLFHECAASGNASLLRRSSWARCLCVEQVTGMAVGSSLETFFLSVVCVPLKLMVWRWFVSTYR